MQIFIKTLTGRKQQFNFEGDSSVLSVKQTLQEKVVALKSSSKTRNFISSFYFRRASRSIRFALFSPESSFPMKKRFRSTMFPQAEQFTWSFSCVEVLIKESNHRSSYLMFIERQSIFEQNMYILSNLFRIYFYKSQFLKV